jgi:hypothetical protein
MMTMARDAQAAPKAGSRQQTLQIIGSGFVSSSCQLECVMTHHESNHDTTMNDAQLNQTWFPTFF